MVSALLIAFAFASAEGSIPSAEPVGPNTARRPACEASTRGTMWPAEANDDGRAANRLAREGRLVVCQKGPWRYHWTSPSVHLRQLTEQARKQGRLRPQ